MLYNNIEKTISRIFLISQVLFNNENKFFFSTVHRDFEKYYFLFKTLNSDCKSAQSLGPNCLCYSPAAGQNSLARFYGVRRYGRPAGQCIDKTVTKRTKCETGLWLNCNTIMLFIPENIKQLKEQIIFQNDFYFKKTKMQLCSTKNNVLLYCLKV